MSTTVDYTPMVDLGFLLITFFMLASSFSQPYRMEVNMPSDSGPEFYKDEIPVSKVATLLLGTDDRLYGYNIPDEIDLSAGVDFEKLNYSPGSLRSYIQKRQEQVKAQWGDRDQLFIMIKPLAGSTYKNVVDILDEMMINRVARYAIMEPSEIVDSLVISAAGESLK